ncbi:MAG: phosphotransferase [Nitrosopumilaceae archaeon]|nr:phosphotransferase [Nitrosopumilaceae archaeon]
MNYKPANKCMAVHKLHTDSTIYDAYSMIYSKEHVEKEKSRLKRRISRYGRGLKGVQLTEIVNEFNDNLFIYFMPVDRRLKNLQKIYDSQNRNTLFNRKLKNELSEQLVNSDIETINYKPENRYVAKLCKDNRELALIKLYDELQYDTALSNTGQYKDSSSFKVQELYLSKRNLNCLVYKWEQGQTLSTFINSNTPDLQLIEKTAEALSDLNSRKIKNQSMFNKDYFVFNLLSIAKDLSYLLPSTAVKLKNIVGKISQLIINMQDIYMPVHGDFNSDQVVVDKDNDSLCFLDFDRTCIGHPAYDVGNFIAHYISKSFREGSSKGVYEISPVFTESFLQHSKIKIKAEDVNTYMVACLIRLLTDPFKYRYKNWDEVTYNLIEYLSQISSSLRDKKQVFVTSDEPFVEIDDAHNIINDSRMEYLKYALDPSYMNSVFNLNFMKKSHTAQQLTGIKAIRYKKEKRCLIEYRLRSEKDFVLLGKTKAGGSVKRNYRINKEIYDAGFSSESDDYISIPMPVFRSPNINMWFQEKIEGKTFTDLLREGEAKDYGQLLAKSAYKIHSCGVDSGKVHTINDEIEILEDRLVQVSQKKPLLNERIKRVLAASKILAAAIPIVNPKSIHRDFYQDQIIISGKRLYVVDFDLFCKGDPALDIGNFLGHLTEFSIRMYDRPDWFIDIEKELEQTYLNYSSTAKSCSVEAYKTLTLARHIYISTLFADRCRFTENILSLCEKRLVEYMQ